MTNVIIGEFVGTILLVLLGDGVCANVTLNNSGFKAAGALFIAIGWGLAVCLPAAAFSGICPASYNPALTIALFADGTLAAADGYTIAVIIEMIIAEMAGGFIGAIAQVLVIFGIHWGLFPIIFSNIEKFGFDTILAVFGPSIIAQSGAAFGVWLKTKDKRLKQIASPAAIMGFFGISEPAIYGITLKYRKAFACAVIGGGIGGAIAGSCGARAMAVAVAAVPTFPAYFGTGFTGFIIAYFGAFLISAVLTYFVGFNDSMIPESERYDAKGTVTPVASSIENNGAIAMKFYSPADGNVVPLTEVSDQAFSSEALGKGIAVKPINGTIVSPIAGTVSAVYPTAHAYGIKGNNNEEILVHIGIDTVKLEGKYFTPNVKTNDIVMPGDLLATIELDKIIEAGYDPTVMVIDTADSSKRNVTLLAKNTVHAKDDLVLIESI